jgi:hypothetical protein
MFGVRLWKGANSFLKHLFPYIDSPDCAIFNDLLKQNVYQMHSTKLGSSCAVYQTHSIKPGNSCAYTKRIRPSPEVVVRICWWPQKKGFS